MADKPRVAVFKFASCDGCQLALLSCEDELLAIADALHLAYFPEASSRLEDGPYDVALVEGSVASSHDLQRVQEIRRQSRVLVAIGACATSGGVQALRNGGRVEAMRERVYTDTESLDLLADCTPIGDHVTVDYELRGCPIDRGQLLRLLASLLRGFAYRPPTGSVCLECKRRGLVCVAVARGEPCLGPVTRAGCNALCPGCDRGCFGCFGPRDDSRPEALAAALSARGVEPDRLEPLLSHVNAGAPAFRRAAESLTKPTASG